MFSNPILNTALRGLIGGLAGAAIIRLPGMGEGHNEFIWVALGGAIGGAILGWRRQNK